MDVIQESSSLDSESGKSISKIERDKIHKAIMLLEEKIKNLKLSIKWVIDKINFFRNLNIGPPLFVSLYKYQCL